MKKPTLLVCNDDGKDSPLLAPFIEGLALEAWPGELRVIVPEHERSWIGTAITRRIALESKKHVFGGQDGFTVSGTPADCANIGIYSIFKDKPDMLISGINLGENIGRAYFLNSGTIGAAHMGVLCGVRAVAVSVCIKEEARLKWLSNDYGSLKKFDEDWRRIALCGVSVIRDLVELNAFDQCRFFSINMPWEVTEDSPRKLACVSDARFNRLFAKRSDGLYEHDMDLPDFLAPEDSSPYEGDWQLVSKGVVSITPVQVRLSGVVDHKLRGILER